MKSDLSRRLLAHLRSGTATASELQALLGASQAAVSRQLRALIDLGQVLKMGSARAVRYGLRRVVESIGSQWPLRRVTAAGDIDELGVLFSLAADEYYLEVYPSAADRGFAWAGLSHGLPYFLQDQRPGGFLGRAIPTRYPELDLPKRVQDWSDDQYLRYLTLRGQDAVGDLVLGDPAFNLYLTLLPHKNRLAYETRELRYPTLADEAMSGEFMGSSAQGEHPKFTAMIEQQETSREVIVKFSPSVATAIGRRWGDLLIAEHHAHAILISVGLPSCKSEILQAGGRVFLEVERFDRHGSQGRIGVSSLFAIDNGIIGGAKDWVDAAQKLYEKRHIDAETLDKIRLAATFGALIANTDRHFGNLACFDRYDGRFELAPIYDMLPMLFAPSHDEIVLRAFEPPEITAATLHAFARARALAERYWKELSEDLRITAEFRGIAQQCHARLAALPRTGPYAYGSEKLAPAAQ